MVWESRGAERPETLPIGSFWGAKAPPQNEEKVLPSKARINRSQEQEFSNSPLGS